MGATMKPAQAIKLAVFGQPVAHSLSPRIHRMFGKQLGIAVDYQAIESGPGDLASRLSAFRESGGSGANLTVPLKEVGLRICSAVDAKARRARAVNTLKAVNDSWQGYNTDGDGLILDLQRLGLSVAERRILIVGAGGAAAGLIEPLLAEGANEIMILNRTVARAERLADKFAHLGPVHAASLELGPDRAGFDLLIQSTSAGHAGQQPVLKSDWLDPGASAYDLNYGPAHQPFARWCAEEHIPAHDGLGMLVGQAALAFEIWTGQRPDMQPVLESLRGG
jgi:shikimate dehydrogenase